MTAPVPFPAPPAGGVTSSSAATTMSKNIIVAPYPTGDFLLRAILILDAIQTGVEPPKLSLPRISSHSCELRASDNCTTLLVNKSADQNTNCIDKTRINRKYGQDRRDGRKGAITIVVKNFLEIDRFSASLLIDDDERRRHTYGVDDHGDIEDDDSSIESVCDSIKYTKRRLTLSKMQRSSA